MAQGLKTLFADEHSVNLLRAEKLDDLPKYLTERIETVHPEPQPPTKGAAS
jgi:hypothetical protein